MTHANDFSCFVPGCPRVSTRWAKARPEPRGSRTRVMFCDECVEGIPRRAIHSYVRSRMKGTSHNLALMFALAQAPRAVTDSTFLRGRCNGNQFEGRPELGDYYAGVARSEGQDTTGKVYLSSLAEYPGDPRAWVSGRGDVQRLCEERGWSCQGSVNVKGAPVEREESPYRVADELVAERAGDLIALGESPADASEKARQQLTPNWS